MLSAAWMTTDDGNDNEQYPLSRTVTSARSPVARPIPLFSRTDHSLASDTPVSQGMPWSPKRRIMSIFELTERERSVTSMRCAV